MPPPDPLRPALVADPHRAAQRPHRPVRPGAPAPVRRADPHLRDRRRQGRHHRRGEAPQAGRQTAHSQLGTAEGVTRQFTSKKEEDRLVKDLLAGKTVEESIDAADGADPGADFLADLLAGVGDQPDNPAPERATVPRLFESTEAFARAALGAAAPELRVDDDGEMLAFRPPDDLVQRLSVLPPSYLKKHDVTERMRVTFDRPLAQRKLDEARQTKTLWPEIAYLSDLHPMIEWLTDKVLLRVPRQQAPVLIAAVDGADLPRPGRLLQRARPAHGRRVDGGHRPARRAARRRHDRRACSGRRSARTW